VLYIVVNAAVVGLAPAATKNKTFHLVFQLLLGPYVFVIFIVAQIFFIVYVWLKVSFLL
jgi:hypothetical protein